jgi:large subunit ribosomal protein L23
MTPFDIIKTVRLTEKGTRQAARHNQYTLVADRRATKPQIKGAVELLFNVKVLAVNTMQVTGKARRKGTLAAGRDQHWKKAIVTLKEGDKIQLT